ncbi:hypothetical protein DTO013E5_2976 [Penicillium roqueforti]|uniref:uncharacterized protein n=1 Tax=Penicillium roqueforti TaxID=5082 RepID=UPI00190BCBFC|nr:uncharacterized protein LCP9604111_3560 [Penicillium roqueforti]KAF9250044.1 hypothetical protein LCP9604111_3560 [Penicillium roqueforti]KAI1831552.1 hypothetical protein CBS147337_7708 [Penicillium roqueforti]KAI2679495.1 hypothetical protein CBS147355_3977 [Penicillium roqueforti]KAI2684563.1 hypothetical protein LCP963914a_5295 [Penicillium roqueforti]KAI2701113.1 hypothetical protein CBS147372_5183 [Penicillium roqueforti]
MYVIAITSSAIGPKIPGQQPKSFSRLRKAVGIFGALPRCYGNTSRHLICDLILNLTLKRLFGQKHELVSSQFPSPLL